MAPPPLLLLLLLLLLSSSSIAIAVAIANAISSPSPTPWPLQFHSLLFVNTSAFKLQALDLWYDWPNSRNFNIIHKQLNGTLHDLEWSNGTSFYYDLGARTCKTVHFEVGILRPDWLVDNSTYLGQHVVDGFTCNAWSKEDFIVYYEDVETNRPVHWVFYTGMSLHVMSFEVGAVLEDSQWQAPAYCFDDDEEEEAEAEAEEEEEEVAKPLLMMTDAARHDKERLQRWHDSLQASLIR